jgi:hypothetical protein
VARRPGADHRPEDHPRRRRPYATIPEDLLLTLLGEIAASPVATMQQHNQVTHW